MTIQPIGTTDTIARWAQVLAPARQIAEIVASTEFVPGALRGNADACTACILYGDEIGIGPMQALASIHVVDGRPQPSAELARSMILRAGHSFIVHVLTPEQCRVSGLRAGQDEKLRTYHEWTMADARRAGLAGRQTWQRYPRAMLLARATGDLARLVFPDVVKGLGHVDETDVEGLTEWADTVAPAEPNKPTAKRTTVRSERKRQLASAADNPLPEAVPDAAPEPAATWRMPADPWLEPGGELWPQDAQKGAQDSPAEQRPPIAPEQPQRPLQDAQLPDTVPVPMGDGLRKAIMASFGTIGIDPTKDRETRLALASALLARPVESFTQLSKADGLLLVRLLNDIESGALMWHDREGTVLLHRVDSE